MKSEQWTSINKPWTSIVLLHKQQVYITLPRLTMFDIAIVRALFYLHLLGDLWTLWPQAKIAVRFVETTKFKVCKNFAVGFEDCFVGDFKGVGVDGILFETLESIQIINNHELKLIVSAANSLLIVSVCKWFWRTAQREQRLYLWLIKLKYYTFPFYFLLKHTPEMSS